MLFEEGNKIEGDAMLTNYTAAQLGDPVYKPLSTRSKDGYDLIVMDGQNQVVVLENASWNKCRDRVVAMVEAGVAPRGAGGRAARRDDRRTKCPTGWTDSVQD